MIQAGNQWWTTTDWDEFFESIKPKDPVYEKFKDLGLFSYIMQHYNLSAVSENLTAEFWDLLYFAKCGSRQVSQIVNFTVREGTETEMNRLGSIIAAYHKISWDHMIAAIQIEYDPIHNQYEEYHETTSGQQIDDIDVEKANSSTTGKTGSDTVTRTDNLSKSETGTLTGREEGSTENNIYGFNSSSAVGSDNNSGLYTDSTNQQNTTTNTGTQTEQNSYGHTVTGTGSGTQQFDSTSTSEGTKDYTRKGNIGNITTQKMLADEIEFWRWNIIDRILNDVKDFTTIPIYAN